MQPTSKYFEQRRDSDFPLRTVADTQRQRARSVVCRLAALSEAPKYLSRLGIFQSLKPTHRGLPFYPPNQVGFPKQAGSSNQVQVPLRSTPAAVGSASGLSGSWDIRLANESFLASTNSRISWGP